MNRNREHTLLQQQTDTQIFINTTQMNRMENSHSQISFVPIEQQVAPLPASSNQNIENLSMHDEIIGSSRPKSVNHKTALKKERSSSVQKCQRNESSRKVRFEEEDNELYRSVVQNKEETVQVPKRRKRKNIFDLSSSFLEDSKSEVSHRSSGQTIGIHDQDGKMKQSQMTTHTHNDLTLNSCDEVGESELVQQKMTTKDAREHRNIFLGISDVQKEELPSDSSRKDKVEVERQNPAQNLLGSYYHAASSAEENEGGLLLSNSQMEQNLATCLENFLKDCNKTAAQPFFENETKLWAGEEIFTFKISFKYENDRIVFDWQRKQSYPSESYHDRKYECVNYFIVEAFSDHIKLFSDFSMLPFPFHKPRERVEVRTQLICNIPLANPQKANIECTSSEGDTTIGVESRVLPMA